MATNLVIVWDTIFVMLKTHHLVALFRPKSQRPPVLRRPRKEGRFLVNSFRIACLAVTTLMNATVLGVRWLAHVYNVHDVHDVHGRYHLGGAVFHPHLPVCYSLATRCVRSPYRCRSLGSGRCRPLRSHGPFPGCASGCTAPDSIHIRYSRLAARPKEPSEIVRTEEHPPAWQIVIINWSARAGNDRLPQRQQLQDSRSCG